LGNKAVFGGKVLEKLAKGMVITIDGPAGSGKSTIARLVAQRIGADFLDTGAMYRAVILAAMKAGIDLADEQKLLVVMDKTAFSFLIKNFKTQVLIDGYDVTEMIRDPKVTGNVRYAAGAASVRARLVQMQRDFAGSREKIVTEGRDQGTVAFADADYKFFLTASEEERAKRRLAELVESGTKANYDEILKAIHARDLSDTSRAVGPLKKADDAILIDTTNLNIEQVVEKVLSFIK
jgi:CMP/dCMP kinase